MSHRNNPEQESVFDAVKKAGSEVGSLLGEVTKKTREQLSGNSDGNVEKLKKDAKDAVESVKKADSRSDYLDAGKDILQDTGQFLSSVAGSVKNAVGEVKNTDQARSSKEALKSVIIAARDRVDDAVRKPKETTPENDDENIVDGEVVTEDEPTTP